MYFFKMISNAFWNSRKTKLENCPSMIRRLININISLLTAVRHQKLARKSSFLYFSSIFFVLNNALKCNQYSSFQCLCEYIKYMQTIFLRKPTKRSIVLPTMCERFWKITCNVTNIPNQSHSCKCENYRFILNWINFAKEKQ